MALDCRAWIFWRFAALQTRRQTFHHLVRIAGKEKRYGIALAAGSIDDPVHGRAEAIICPARDQVAEVNDEGACDWGCMNPLAFGLSLNLETADLILQEQRNAPEIAVRAGTLFAGSSICRLRGIMQESQHGMRVGAIGREIFLIEVESQRQAPHQRPAQIEHGAEVGFSHWPESSHANRPKVGAVIETPRHHPGVIERQLGPNIKALLEIGRRTRLQRLRPHRFKAALTEGEAFIDGAFRRSRAIEEAPRLIKESHD